MSWWTDEAGRDDSDVDETIDRAAFVAGLPADSPSPAAAESPLNDPFHTPYPTTAFNQAPSTSPDADGADRPYNWYEGMGKASGTAGSVPAYPSATSEAFRSTARLEQQVQAPPPFPSPSLHQTHAAVPQQPAPRTQQMPVATPGNPMGLAPGAAPAGSFQQVPPPPSGPYSAVPNYGQVINSEAYASFGQRFAALLIDGLFTSIVLAAIVVAAGVGVGAAVASAAGAKVRSDDLIFFALIAYIAGSSLGSAAYFLIGLSRGQTLGLQSMGIRLCRESGAPLGIWRVIGRNMVSILSALPLMAGYFAPLWSPKRQTWHDSIMGTVVVRDNVSRLARKAVVWGGRLRCSGRCSVRCSRGSHHCRDRAVWKRILLFNF